MSLVASQLDGLGSVLTGAGAPPASPSGGVTSFNGATGVVGYAPTIFTPSLATLATLPTLGALSAGGYSDGQLAWVLSVKKLFVLQTALGGAANGVNTIATADDPTRMWVLQGLLTESQWFETAELDLTGTPSATLVPSVPGYYFLPMVGRLWLTSTSGSLSTTFTFKAGNDGLNSNVMTSQSPVLTGPFAIGAPIMGPALGVNTVAVRLADTTTASTLVVTAGATGAGLVLRGRIGILGILTKVSP